VLTLTSIFELNIVTKLPFGMDGYGEKNAKGKADDPKHRGSLLDYQHVGYLVQLSSDSKQPPIVMPPTVRRQALGKGFYDIFEEPQCDLDLIFEEYESARIKGSISQRHAAASQPQPGETTSQSQPKEARGLLDKICPLALSSHSIKKYSDGLSSAEEHFATYGTDMDRYVSDDLTFIEYILAENALVENALAGSMLAIQRRSKGFRKFMDKIRTPFSWLFGLSSPGKSNDRSSGKYRSCDESQRLFDDSEPGNNLASI
jgi:hypothetical protein